MKRPSHTIHPIAQTWQEVAFMPFQKVILDQLALGELPQLSVLVVK